MATGLPEDPFRLGRVEREAVDRLVSSRGDKKRIRRVLSEYIVLRIEAGLHTGEILEEFCVSTPNILESAGFEGRAAKRLMLVFGKLLDEELKKRPGAV